MKFDDDEGKLCGFYLFIYLLPFLFLKNNGMKGLMKFYYSSGKIPAHCHASQGGIMKTYPHTHIFVSQERGAFSS